MIEELKKILETEQCSLVVWNCGRVTCYNKPGVRDLEHLLDNEPEMLRGAVIADKVIGKAAAGMVAVGRVKELYAEVMSKKAIPLLEKAGIAYSYGKLVDGIVEEGDRCKLEQITADCATAEDVVAALRAHFAEMKKKPLPNPPLKGRA